MHLIAHRGLQTKNAKENTLVAIELADKNPWIDGVEIDVRLTKDNKVVVIHDDVIDRVSNGSGKVREMTLDRLRRFNYGSFLKRSTISTLEDVLSDFSENSLLIIELKDEMDKNNILSSRVLEITSRYPNLSIWFKSFSEEIVNYLKKYNNRPVGILINKDNIELLNLEVDFISVSKNVINDEIIRENKDKVIMIWTIKSKEEMEALKNKLASDLNNIYIISDNPLLYCK